MLIREEFETDQAAIRRLVTHAFAGAAHSSGTEVEIIDALRSQGALTISIVAEDGGETVGHCAVSAVTISGASGRWFGLGPVAVHPARQGCGIGTALIDAALERLRVSGAAGCVVLGDPGFYGRFGFRHDPALTYADVPAPYFQYLAFGQERPGGSVKYHPAFG